MPPILQCAIASVLLLGIFVLLLHYMERKNRRFYVTRRGDLIESAIPYEDEDRLYH